MLAALSPLIYLMASVPVAVTGPTTVLPAKPDPAHAEVLWPTSQIAMYTNVLMADGSRWQVPRVPKRLGDGSVSFTLKSPVSTAVTTYVVAKNDLDTPIWWVGEVIQEPVGEDPIILNPPPPDMPSEPTTLMEASEILAQG